MTRTAQRPTSGPDLLSTIGLLVRLARDPLRAVSDAARLHGDMVGLGVGRHRFFLVSHPDLIEEVLVTDARHYAKSRGLERARRVLGDGLLTSQGEAHLRMRRLVQPHFQERHVESYAAAMTEETTRAAERWVPGQVMDAAREMNRITMRIVARTLFGADMRAESDEVGMAVQTMIELFDSKLLPTAALTDRLPLPGTRRFEAAERTLDSMIWRMIDERRADPGQHDDVLETLLTMGGDSGSGRLTDRQVRDEVTTLFLAGHETTANWLAWTWYLLALHPRVEARLHQEVDTVLDGRPATADDRPALPFTRQVLAESLRLFPTVWMVGRRALEPTTIGGHGVPARSIVMMSPWVVQRDPRWFEVPARFDPDRWTPDVGRGRPRFAYFPFGGGMRRCLGESFAWLEATLILASLARQWRFRLAPGRRVVPLPRITLRPRDGVQVVPERRI